MKKINLKENSKRIKFWDRIFWVMIISFVISIALVFIVPENSLENNSFVYPWLVLFLGAIILELIFTSGMIYHAFRLKRYGWGIVNIFLGTIFPIIFYFSILKKEFENEKKIKSAPERNKKNV